MQAVAGDHWAGVIVPVFVFICICICIKIILQAVAGDHWAGVGVLVAAKEGAWLLKPTRAPEKVSPVFVFVFVLWLYMYLHLYLYLYLSKCCPCSLVAQTYQGS